MSKTNNQSPTPGPWKWDNRSPADRLIQVSTGDVVVATYAHGKTPEGEPIPSGLELSEADARLIKAAPELLKRFEGLVSTLIFTRGYACTEEMMLIKHIHGAPAHEESVKAEVKAMQKSFNEQMRVFNEGPQPDAE